MELITAKEFEVMRKRHVILASGRPPNPLGLEAMKLDKGTGFKTVCPPHKNGHCYTAARVKTWLRNHEGRRRFKTAHTTDGQLMVLRTR